MANIREYFRKVDEVGDTYYEDKKKTIHRDWEEDIDIYVQDFLKSLLKEKNINVYIEPETAKLFSHLFYIGYIFSLYEKEEMIRNMLKSERNEKLDYYMQQPWSYKFDWDTRNNVYVASITELPACSSHGDTIDGALRNIKEVLKIYLEVALGGGGEIPTPSPHKDREGDSE